MMAEAQMFWDSIVGKIRNLIRRETANAFRAERYEVTTAPNGTVIGVTKALGSKEIFLPYSQEVSTATIGQPVLVVWWGSMSNAKVYYYANGYNGGGGGGGTGYTFIPNVSEAGIISWTNNGGLPNPTPRDIMGPQGDSGVYYGTDTPPAGTKVWIDPSGDADEIETGQITQIAGGGTFTYQCYKRLGVVTFYAAFAAGSSNANTYYFQLPPGFRPYAQIMVSAAFNTGSWVSYNGIVNTDGTVGIAYSGSSVTYVRIWGTFVAGG